MKEGRKEKLRQACLVVGLCLICVSMPFAAGYLEPVSVEETFSVADLENTLPTPYKDGWPQECEGGGFVCYYEWGGVNA